MSLHVLCRGSIAIMSWKLFRAVLIVAGIKRDEASLMTYGLCVGDFSAASLQATPCDVTFLHKR